MVNIRSLIDRKKAQFRAAKSSHSQADNLKRAEELQRLRQQRIQLEGKAKLEQARNSELKRIQTAKDKTPNKLRALGQGLAKTINKHKEKKGKGTSFGKNVFGEVNRGSTGLNFGGNNNTNFGTGTGSSPFNPKPIIDKKKFKG